MAITKKPLAADAHAPYTVTRAFFWDGEVKPAGTVLQITKADVADLLLAKKVEPGDLAAELAAEKAEAEKLAAEKAEKPSKTK